MSSEVTSAEVRGRTEHSGPDSPRKAADVRREPGSRGVRVPAALAAILVAGSCAQPQGAVFPPPDEPLRWPPPPAPARIAYVGQIATDEDLRPARSLGAVIFGDEATRSMLSPYGVCTDGGDRVFVSDSNAQVVHVFNLASRAYRRWGEDEGGVRVPAIGRSLSPSAWRGIRGDGCS